LPRPSGPARLSLLYAVVFTEIGIAMPFLTSGEVGDMRCDNFTHLAVKLPGGFRVVG